MQKIKSRNGWLWDVPEDLEVAVSERDFLRATKLVIKAHDYLNRILEDFDKNERWNENSSKESKANWQNLHKRIERKERRLTDVLQGVLVNAANTHGQLDWGFYFSFLC